MTPTLLREIGEALDGSTWQTAQARRRNVAVRTVQRWAAGTSQIPPITADLVADIDARISELRRLRAQLVYSREFIDRF